MAREQGSIDIPLEAIHFCHALIESTIVERDELRLLATAFINGKPIDPESLAGRRCEIALAFYIDIEAKCEDDDTFPHGPFEIAKIHARHRAAAAEIAARAKRRKGEKKGIRHRVYEIVDDFLLVLLAAAKAAGVATKLPSTTSEEGNEFARFIQSAIDTSERVFVALAERRQLPPEVTQKVKLALSDLSGRRLNDRMRRIINEFGQIDWKPPI